MPYLLECIASWLGDQIPHAGLRLCSCWAHAVIMLCSCCAAMTLIPVQPGIATPPTAIPYTPPVAPSPDPDHLSTCKVLPWCCVHVRGVVLAPL